MKTFTDFNQSKILAKFLPVESADLYYLAKDDRGTEFFSNPSVKDGVCEDIDVPCWSLAALLCVLPYPYIEQNFMGKWTCKVEQKNIIFLREASNSVDACYEMIVELNKHNLI